jgi:hypothetical protein
MERMMIASYQSARFDFRYWLSALCLFLCAGLAQAQAPAPSQVPAQDDRVATVTHLSGTFVAKRLDGSTRLLSLQSAVQQGDTLTTEAGTYARLKFIDGGEVVLRPNTQFQVSAYRYNLIKPEEDNALFNLVKGGMRAVTGLLGKRSKEKVQFQTTTATIGIRGTNLGMQLCNNDCNDIPTISGNPPENGLYVDVASGEVEVSNPAGTQRVQSGQFAYVASPRTAPQLVPPERGLQVTMPQSISNNASDGRSLGGDARDTSCTF